MIWRGFLNPYNKQIFQEYEFTIAENVDPGTLVGKVGLSDGDGLDEVDVAIRDIQAAEYFTFNKMGQILTNKKIDFEKTPR